MQLRAVAKLPVPAHGGAAGLPAQGVRWGELAQRREGALRVRNVLVVEEAVDRVVVRRARDLWVGEDRARLRREHQRVSPVGIEQGLLPHAVAREEEAGAPA